MFRTVVQSIVAPVLSTSLYFVIFGSAIGSRIAEIDGVSYGAFIVPGLIMLSIMTESLSNSSFAIYFPKFTGAIFSPVIITGYVPDLLKSVSMVGGDLRISGLGMCGKGYKEWVKVTDGGPHMRLKARLG